MRAARAPRRAEQILLPLIRETVFCGGRIDAHAADRIEDLKSRGFENAGLYDPPGVSGTHVMYVLHHADTPHIYNGLPDNPHISGTVRLWKGITKPLALAAMALAALTGFFHYIRVGPNETDEGDEARAADEMAKTPSSPEKRP